MTDVKKIAETLQDAEIVVLKVLTKGSATIEDIANKSMLQESAVSRAGLWLQNKDLVTVEEKTYRYVSLTELGQKYIKQKLPEKRLLEAIKNSPKYIDEIVKDARLDKQEFTVALGYCKANNFAEFENGKITITEYGAKLLSQETPEESLLKKLSNIEVEERSLKANEKTIFENLNKRTLAKLTEKKIRTFAATELAKRIISAVPSESRIGQLTPEKIRDWEKHSFRRYDVEAPTPKIYGGKKQVYRAFLDEVKKELVSLGFQEMSGPLVEAEFWNNDALYMPQDHPARGIHDVFFVKEPKYGNLDDSEQLIKNVKSTHETGGKSGSTGWRYDYNEKASGRLILRSQGTALSARTLASKDVKNPGAYFAVSRVFRPEKIDATHLAEFDQCEGLIIGENVNFQNLLGLLEQFAKKFTNSDKIKFKPSYFPFTEPSVEAHVWHPKLNKWVEIFGAGILRPEVTKPLGIDVPVLAWGIGVSRLFMIKEDISDIRQLFSQDLDFLRKAKL